MKIKTVSPIGRKSPGLFETFPKEWFVEKVEDADVLWFDLWNGFGEYDLSELDAVLLRRIPVCVFDAFDQWGSPAHRPEWIGFDDWKLMRERADKGQEWAFWLRLFLDAGMVRLYFLRKMAKSWEYPPFVRPMELVQYPDHDFPPASLEEFSARPFDACFIGASSPWRANLVCDLLRAGFKVDCFFPHVRIEHAEWLARHRQARFFIEADGGGFGSERPYQLVTMSAMLKATNDQRIVNDFEHMKSCVKVGDVWGCLEMGEQDGLAALFSVPERCYEIYRTGIDHLHRNFSAEARAEYAAHCMSEVGL